MNDDAFARLVAEQVKNKATSSQEDYLRLPENWERWQRALAALIENLDEQLERVNEADRLAEQRYGSLGDSGVRMVAEALAANEDKRKKIERFRFHVSARLDEVTRMIALGSDAVDERMSAMLFLRRAIERHREMMREFDLDTSAVDEALWDALEGKWAFDQIDTTDWLID